MWQNEYFYLDGSVVLTVNESGADHGLSVFPTTWDAVEKDITTGPAQGVKRYGLVRDTRGDDTPVPQYLTRARPADAATVPQRSRVWRAFRNPAVPCRRRRAGRTGCRRGWS